jgi:hypothetical protein
MHRRDEKFIKISVGKSEEKGPLEIPSYTGQETDIM